MQCMPFAIIAQYSFLHSVYTGYYSTCKCMMNQLISSLFHASIVWLCSLFNLLFQTSKHDSGHGEFKLIELHNHSSAACNNTSIVYCELSTSAAV